MPPCRASSTPTTAFHFTSSSRAVGAVPTLRIERGETGLLVPRERPWRPATDWASGSGWRALRDALEAAYTGLGKAQLYHRHLLGAPMHSARGPLARDQGGC